MKYVCVYCDAPIEGIMVGAGDGDGQKFAHPDCYWRAEFKRVVTEVKDGASAWNEAILRCMDIVEHVAKHNLVYDSHGQLAHPHYQTLSMMRDLLAARKVG